MFLKLIFTIIIIVIMIIIIITNLNSNMPHVRIFSYITRRRKTINQ